MTLRKIFMQSMPAEDVAAQVEKMRRIMGILDAIEGTQIAIMIACGTMMMVDISHATGNLTTLVYNSFYELAKVCRVLCMVALLVMVIGIFTKFHKLVFSSVMVWFGVCLYPALMLLVEAHGYAAVETLLRLETTIFSMTGIISLTLAIVGMVLSLRLKKLSKLKKEELENE